MLPFLKELFAQNPMGQKLGYTTQLGPKAEENYKKWALNLAGQNPNFSSAVFEQIPDGYDYRAAFLENMQPEVNQADGLYHLGDIGKRPDHQSFSEYSIWNQSQEAPTWLGLGSNEVYFKPFKWGKK